MAVSKLVWRRGDAPEELYGMLETLGGEYPVLGGAGGGVRVSGPHAWFAASGHAVSDKSDRSDDAPVLGGRAADASAGPKQSDRNTLASA